MYEDVLVPTDGSPGVEGAVARALDLARTGDAAVHVLHVVDETRGTAALDADAAQQLRAASERRGRDAALRIQEQADELGLETHRAVRRGVPYREILEYVEENDVELVVMGTRARMNSDRSRLGSTTERVLTFAAVPVLAVPLDEETDVPEPGYGMYDTVLVPTDGSDAAERAAAHGLEIAERYGADVHAMYVIDASTYVFEDVPRSIVGLLKEGGRNAVDAVANEGADRGLDVSTNVLRGLPHEEIREYAAGIDADVIAMGTRGRTPDTDRLLGSTTARVARRTNVPVLTRT